jgi:hypothetical protein
VRTIERAELEDWAAKSGETVARVKALPEPFPSRIASLSVSSKGYPVPWFVAWLRPGGTEAPASGFPSLEAMAANDVERALLASYRVDASSFYPAVSA